MAGRLGDLAWSGLSHVGLGEDRWKGLRPWQQRAVKAVVVGVVATLVLGPIYGLDRAAYLAFGVVAILYIPDWSRFRFGKYVVPVTVFALCFAYPYYYEDLPSLPIFTSVPSISTAFLMAIYVMMALGLNIVVGYAGLLDL